MNTTTQLATVNVMVKKFMDWAISSQAAKGLVDGSTTNRSSLDQAKRTRARGSMYKKVTGIYEIRHEATGSVYFGSAVCIKGRINMHKRELRNGIHSNSFLQGMYNKYGDQLVFRVVEECDRAVLRKREQAYIDAELGRLMNLDKVVCELAPAEVHSARMATSWKNRSEETKAMMSEKISKSLKSYFSDSDNRQRNAERLSEARSSENFKVKHQSLEAKAKRSKAMKQFWSSSKESQGKLISNAMNKMRKMCVCGHCGTSFEGMPNSKWCSPSCRMDAFVVRQKAASC